MRLNLTAGASSTGYGVAGLNLALALGDRAAFFPLGGVEVEPRHQAALRAAVERQADYDPEAPSLRLWHPFDLAQHVGRGRRWGWPVFELSSFSPRERHHLRAQDGLVVCSEWARGVCVDEGVAAAGDVRVVPLGFDPAVFRPCPLPQEGPTVFLNVGKWEVRKGHAELLECFDRAFAPSDDVLLFLHCHNPCRGPDYSREWEQMAMSTRMGRAGKVATTNGARFPSQGHVAALMVNAHAGVFPARAEGFNLEALEMLAMGRHVVLTDYGGHTAFAGPLGARLVPPGPPEPAYDGHWFFGQGCWPSWGDEQSDALVAHLRDLHRLRQGGGLQMNVAQAEKARAHFTWGAVAQHVVDNLLT